MSLRKCPNCSRILSSSQAHLSSCPSCQCHLSNTLFKKKTKSEEIVDTIRTRSNREKIRNFFFGGCGMMALPACLMGVTGFQVTGLATAAFALFSAMLAFIAFIGMFVTMGVYLLTDQ